MSLTVYAFFALLTCVYWLASLFVLLLRIGDPHFRSMAQYGGRQTSSSSTSLAVSSSGKQLTSNIVKEENKFSYFMNYIKNTWILRRIRENVTTILIWLEGSFLGQMRVSRKYSFCAFYITGIVSSLTLLFLEYFQLYLSSIIISTSCSEQVLKNTLWPYDLLPLVAFLIHCTVRLWECLFVHRFRNGKGDSVTLFAAFAGCSFYVFAANSSSAIIFRAVQIEWLSSHECKGFELSGNVYDFKFSVMIIVICFVLHLILQGVQVLHHRILAKLRNESSTLIKSHEKNVIMKHEKVIHNKDMLNQERKGTSGSMYHFPYTSLFVYVLEPHYTCEIVMYLVNTISIWSLLYPSTPLLLMTACEGEGDCHVSLMLLLVFISLLLNYVAPLGVLLFSLCNLAITASEHRRFWNHVNREREKKEQLPRWDLFYLLW
ncbi:uncharacterized protein TM35_000053420 [Trypanosoma theileri]|uniref:Uncharacterized protein n=1 Tax=Trypanosoma theileri TaxID=67003 RepID=A0A1X0P483_9TRYP|nr:uncharacterized protein TM35_000053420 [Trypanosoma theileri]ORC91746.1 hypothetical protein TM35_000053420 [Trypanosoma theileri]